MTDNNQDRTKADLDSNTNNSHTLPPKSFLNQENRKNFNNSQFINSVNKFQQFCEDSRTKFILNLLSPIITGVAVVIAFYSFGSNTSQYKFDQDQRAVEITLQLATYWENNLDETTRKNLGKILAIKDEDKRHEILGFLAKYDDSFKFNNLKNKQYIIEFFNLNLNSKNYNIATKILPYRIAIVRAINTLETVVVTRKNLTGKKAKCIIDLAYMPNVDDRYKQLKPFIESLQKKESKNAWKPLQNFLEKEWNFEQKKLNCDF